jgi:hypothetical protein
VVSFTARPLYTGYQLNRRLGGPQSRSALLGELKILDPNGTRTQTPARRQSLCRLRYPKVKVKVTLRLTVSLSVCLGVELNLGLLTRDFFVSKVTVLSLWGALSDERSGLYFVGLLSVKSIVVPAR